MTVNRSKRPGDLAPFLEPVPSAGLDVIQGVITAFNAGTNENTVELAGGRTETDLPIIGDPGLLGPDRVVMVLRKRTRYFILGPIVTGASAVSVGRLIAYGEDDTASQVSSSITLVTLSNVPLSADRVYRMEGSTRARATDSGDFGGLILAEINVAGTPVGRDRAILRASTATAATNYLKPNASGFTPGSTGTFTVTLTGGTGNGTGSDVDWRGAGGDAFAHWLAVYDAGLAL